MNADDAHLVALVENLLREDLSPEKEADDRAELVRTPGWTLEHVAEAVRRSARLDRPDSRPHISRPIRLAQPLNVLVMLARAKTTPWHPSSPCCPIRVDGRKTSGPGLSWPRVVSRALTR
jgi:hypothetical protein